MTTRGVAAQGLGDLHHLPLRDAQVIHAQVRVDALEAQLLQARAGLPVRRRPVHDARASVGSSPEEQVLGDAQLRDQAELLVDGADALVAGVVRRPRVIGDAVDCHGAGVGRHGPGEDAHERRLAGAVLAR